MVLNEPQTSAETIYGRNFGHYGFNLARTALVRNAMLMPPHTISLPPQSESAVLHLSRNLNTGVKFVKYCW